MSVDLLKRTMEKHCIRAVPPAVEALNQRLLNRYGDSVRAILFYGACLRTGDPYDGLVDLYVIVDDYRSAYGKWLPAVCNQLLSPNVYYLQANYKGKPVRAKYAVISLSDFRRGTSPRWFHSYMWARFAQPCAIVYRRNEQCANQVYRALARATVTFVSRVLPLLPREFNTAQLWYEGLGHSYAAELRTEHPERTRKLVAANLHYYNDVTPLALIAASYAVAIDDTVNPLHICPHIAPMTRWASRLTWRLRKIQGKLLSLLRLIKGLFTFDGGLDYIVWKLERHSGEHIDLSPYARNYPLFFVWGTFWRLYRKGVFR